MSGGFSASRAAASLDTFGKTPDIVKYAGLSMLTLLRVLRVTSA